MIWMIYKWSKWFINDLNCLQMILNLPEVALDDSELPDPRGAKRTTGIAPDLWRCLDWPRPRKGKTHWSLLRRKTLWIAILWYSLHIETVWKAWFLNPQWFANPRIYHVDHVLFQPMGCHSADSRSWNKPWAQNGLAKLHTCIHDHTCIHWV